MGIPTSLFEWLFSSANLWIWRSYDFQMTEVDAKLAPVNVGHKLLHADRSSEDEQLLIWPLLRKSKNANVACRWKLKFTFYILERTREPFNLDKWSYVHWKIMDIRTSFIWIINFFVGAFEYGGIPKFWGYVGTRWSTLCRFCNFGIVIYL
jgi:hypothetical protein